MDLGYKRQSPKAVAKVFENYPKAVRSKLLFLRQLIFETAERTQGVGELEETLKWNQPSYLTPETKSGSTIRIGRLRKLLSLPHWSIRSG